MTWREEHADGRGERLEQLARALQEAQTMLLEQSRKLDELRAASAQPGDALDDMRVQLEIVTAERDQLQTQLLRLEGMQTETIALSDDSATRKTYDTQPSLPSIDDLMSGLDAILGESEARQSKRQLSGPSAEAPELADDEMIAPEVIAPEAFSSDPAAAPPAANQHATTMLVFMDGVDGGRAVKVPLQPGTMTIGRSESASIRIDSPYVSRIHARLISRGGETEIVDAGSTNGFKINAVAVKRHRLRHGDVITIGQRRLTFVHSDQPI